MGYICSREAKRKKEFYFIANPISGRYYSFTFGCSSQPDCGRRGDPTTGFCGERIG
jgi:hypothetical protein